MEKSNCHNYFQLAQHWADDYHLMATLAHKRWRFFCLVLLVPALLLCLLCIAVLIPLQHLQPLLINHYQDGSVTVTPIKQTDIPSNKAEQSSDILRYVIHRESYSRYSLRNNYQLIRLLSKPTVFNQYQQQLHLKYNHYKTVTINSVLFLDRDSQQNPKKNRLQHHNLAQVDFTVVDHNIANGQMKYLPKTALISWEYRGTPKDPMAAWRDWNGFTVLSYQVQSRFIDLHRSTQ